jgi:hypothetical protein
MNFIISLVLHPSKKLSWFIQHMPDKAQDVHQMFLRSVCDQFFLNSVWESNTILNSLNNTDPPQVLRRPTPNMQLIIQQTLKLTGLMLSWAQIHMLIVVLAALYKQRLIPTSMIYQRHHIPVS